MISETALRTSAAGVATWFVDGRELNTLNVVEISDGNVRWSVARTAGGDAGRAVESAHPAVREFVARLLEVDRAAE